MSKNDPSLDDLTKTGKNENQQQPKREDSSEKAQASPVVKNQAKVEEMAFELFKKRSNGFNSQAGASIARRCFADAEVFALAQDQWRNGEFIASDETEILADGYCPNKKPNHPYNITSKEQGNIQLIFKIDAVLKADIGQQLKSLPEFGWEEKNGFCEELQIARKLIPEFATRIRNAGLAPSAN